MKNHKRRSFVVIGLGNFGGTVAPALASMGDDVLGIDVDARLVQEYSSKLPNVVIADARNENALREAGVGNYDVVIVAIGEDLEANILATMNAKTLGVRTVWVKAQSDTHQRILTRIGVERVIRPERDMGMQIAEILHTPHVFDYIRLGHQRYMVSFAIQADMKKQPISALINANDTWEIIGVMRGTDYISASKHDTIIQERDHLLAIGTKEELRELSGLL